MYIFVAQFYASEIVKEFYLIILLMNLQRYIIHCISMSHITMLTNLSVRTSFKMNILLYWMYVSATNSYRMFILIEILTHKVSSIVCQCIRIISLLLRAILWCEKYECPYARNIIQIIVMGQSMVPNTSILQNKRYEIDPSLRCWHKSRIVVILREREKEWCTRSIINFMNTLGSCREIVKYIFENVWFSITSCISFWILLLKS